MPCGDRAVRGAGGPRAPRGAEDSALAAAGAAAVPEALEPPRGRCRAQPGAPALPSLRLSRTAGCGA